MSTTPPPTATDSSPRVRGLVDRAARAALRALWSVIVPALLAGLSVRYLVPTPAEAKGTLAERLAALGDDHALGVGVALFLMFAAVVHYWSYALPGSRYLRVPPRVEEADDHRTGLRLVGAVVFGAVAALGFRSLVGSYRVLSGSMLPTLLPGDLVAGSKLAYRNASRSAAEGPGRGDVIVFRKPAGVEGPDELVKRVIGLPGDHVSVHGARPVINGWEVPTCDAGGYLYPFSGGAASGRLHVEFLDDHAYLTLVAPSTDHRSDSYEVKAGEVFVLGDNRNNSSDSRSWNEGRGGGLPIGEIEARVQTWLFGVHRNQHIDLGGALRPIDLRLRLEGLDASELTDGIENCLRNRPAQTHPPGPSTARVPVPAKAEDG